MIKIRDNFCVKTDGKNLQLYDIKNLDYKLFNIEVKLKLTDKDGTT